MTRNLFSWSSMIASLVLMLLNISLLSGYSEYQSSYYDHSLSQCPLMFYYNPSTHSCQCFPYDPHIICDGNDSFVDAYYILMFDSKRNVVTASESKSYKFYFGTNITNEYRLLPRSKYELNNFICGPMNRRGYMCTDCIDGFGPSMAEHPNDCFRCTDNWHGATLYLTIMLVPVTLFYLIILVFQVSLTSVPMPCFIMYSQLISIAFAQPFNLQRNYPNYVH